MLVVSDGVVLAEVFVNRRAAGSEEADYPVYVGATEHHFTTRADAVSTLSRVRVTTG
jgi:hypothetical protein